MTSSDNEDDLFADEPEEDMEPEDIAQKLMAPRNKTERSGICAGLWGLNDTLKSGNSIDCRSKKQIKDHALVMVIDLDDANETIWEDHWDSSPDIRVMNPTVWKKSEVDEKREIDYDKTLKVIHAIVAGIEDMIKNGTEVAATIFDGLDKLLDNSENTMRMDKQLEIDEGVTFAFWRRRNKYFLDIVKATKSLTCARYFITHSKKVQKKKTNQAGQEVVVKEWEEADWHKSVPDEMWQVITCHKEENLDGDTTYSAKVVKFKGRPELVGSTHTTMTVKNGKVKFRGLPFLRDKKNVEVRK